ncbi:hypothetical protein QW131_16495 [Roseibium salinum]|nr:hypothetical protein [Roseibium salinum]
MALTVSFFHARTAAVHEFVDLHVGIGTDDDLGAINEPDLSVAARIGAQPVIFKKMSV